MLLKLSNQSRTTIVLAVGLAVLIGFLAGIFIGFQTYKHQVNDYVNAFYSCRSEYYTKCQNTIGYKQNQLIETLTIDLEHRYNLTK